MDFDDARRIAAARLEDEAISLRLSAALAARFREIIVDEAQDCNLADLSIIKWLVDAGIPTKVICDPHQSIFEFRGGVTDQLFDFAATFDKTDQLNIQGNFRSSSNICKAIVMMRARKFRDTVDESLSKFIAEVAPVYILSYSDRSVPATIGRKFIELLNQMGFDIASAPVLAATRDSGSNAIGLPVVIKATRDLTFRLAESVSDFYFAFDLGNQKSALEELHKVILELEGKLDGMSYHRYLIENDIKPSDWRPQILFLTQALRYDSSVFADADAWHQRAKELLGPLVPAGGRSISQKLKKNNDIARVLIVPPAHGLAAKTIHSVKGMEFPAVCVVTTRSTLKGILDFLETGEPQREAESARELYVAASRAQRLLVIAAPKCQSARFASHLKKAGAMVEVLDI